MTPVTERVEQRRLFERVTLSPWNQSEVHWTLGAQIRVTFKFARLSNTRHTVKQTTVFEGIVRARNWRAQHVHVAS